MRGSIRSKAATAAYRDNFDRIFGAERRRWRAFDKKLAKSLDGASRGLRLPSRTRVVDRKTLMPERELSDGVRAAINVMRGAESRKERDMMKSLLISDGQLANRTEIATAEREVRILRGDL